jgi:MSHA biogenesis protein MshK
VFKFLLAALLLVVPLLSQAQLNDPMRPAQAPRATATPGTPTPDWRLDSIIFSGERRLAVINGQHVSEGDQLGQARISHIEATRVTLRVGQQSRVLTLLPVSVKTPSIEAAP